MPVVGRTRPFGDGPFGFAGFGSWRLDRAGVRAAAAGQACGGVRRVREAEGLAAAAGAPRAVALNPKASGAVAAASSAVQGAVRRDGIRGAAVAGLSDMTGGLARTLGANGRALGQAALRGRLRELWDRPDDLPAMPSWQPSLPVPGAGAPWNPVTPPPPSAWAPRPPQEI
jgi:hypothetical protein